MSDYVKWAEKTLADFSDTSIEDAYSKGFVLTRKFKGSMEQTRSIRINLNEFELNSENRRVLGKFIGLEIDVKNLPFENYSFEIHKMGKDFYSTKFGDKTMSASKIREIFNEAEKSNFNRTFVYTMDSKTIGYCISLETENIVHYSYPFYDLQFDKTSLGITMMTLAIKWAKESGKKYIYLGSYKDSSYKYKLQFKGIEWFDSQKWNTDLEELKSIN